MTFAQDIEKAEYQIEKSITLEQSKLTQEITFQESFLEAPVIYITLTKTSMASQKYRFEIDVTEVNTKGFKLIYKIHSQFNNTINLIVSYFWFSS